MGVLTDFVVVDRSDAQRVCNSACPSKEFSGIDAKGIDPVKLGTLYSILSNSEHSDIDCSLLASGGDEGPWVMEVPPDLVRRLASLDAAGVAENADKWSRTEEFSPQYDNWPKEAVHSVLTEFAALSSKAVAANKSILMWVSL